MAKKVSIKKLIKEQDAFFSTTDRIYNFCLEHTRQIFIAAAVVIVLAVAASVIVGVRGSRLKSASAAYFGAKAEYSAADTLANMEKVRSEWAGTPAARAASYAMVDSYVELGRFGEARDLLAELYGSLPKGEESLRVLIAGYLGGLSEELGDYEKALSCYQESFGLAGKAPGNASYEFMASLEGGQARALTALGRTDEARAVLSRTAEAYPGTLQGYMASFQLKSLGSGPTAAPAAGQAAPAGEASGSGAPAPASGSAADEAPAGGEADKAGEGQEPGADSSEAKDSGAASNDAKGSGAASKDSNKSGADSKDAKDSGADSNEAKGSGADTKEAKGSGAASKDSNKSGAGAKAPAGAK
jgi:tetratricopeptide (TPR) repeat protein